MRNWRRNRYPCGCSIDLSRDFCFADLADSSQIGSLFENSNVVFHLADVVAGIAYVFDNQASLFRENVLINENVFHAVQMAKSVSDYIYVGTACSYPLELQSSYETVALREEQTYPAHPESAYGWSKLIGEYESNLYSQTSGLNGSLNIGLLRFHNLYGPRAQYYHPELSQALPSLIRKAINYPREEFRIWGSGKQYRDFLFISDAITALLAMWKYGMNEGVIQVGTGLPTTLLEASSIIEKLSRKCLSKQLNLQVDASKREGDRGRVAVLDRAKDILKWTPKINIHEGLARTFAWIARDAWRRRNIQQMEHRSINNFTLECLQNQSWAARGNSAYGNYDPPLGAHAWNPPARNLVQQMGEFTCNYTKSQKEGEGALIIIIASLKSHHITWSPFKIHMLDNLKADLALSIPSEADDSSSSFHKVAKFVWRVVDPSMTAYEPFQHSTSPNYRHYYNDISRQCFHVDFTVKDAEAIGEAFPGSWLGGITETKQPTDSGNHLFYRWFALQNIVKNDLLDKYKHFVITSADLLYQAPHPPIDQITRGVVYTPDNDYSFRHTVFHSSDAIDILSIAESLIKGGPQATLHRLRSVMHEKISYNFDHALKAFYSQLKLQLKLFPPVAFTVTDESEFPLNETQQGKHVRVEGYYWAKNGEEYESTVLQAGGGLNYQGAAINGVAFPRGVNVSSTAVDLATACPRGSIAKCILPKWANMNLSYQHDTPNTACKLFVELVVQQLNFTTFSACVTTHQTSKTSALAFCKGLENRVIFCDKDPSDPMTLELPKPTFTVHTLQRKDHEPWQDGILAVYASYSFIHRSKYTPNDLLNLPSPSVKSKFCSFMYHNNDRRFEGVRIRLDLLSALNKLKHVDVGTKLEKHQNERFSSNSLGLHDFYDDNVEINCPYKFVIAVENTEFVDWITERIVNAYLARSIPIYWGSPEVDKYFNPATYIDVRKFKSLDAVALYVMEVDRNETLYNSFFIEPPISQQQWDSLFWWWHGKPVQEVEKAKLSLIRLTNGYRHNE